MLTIGKTYKRKEIAAELGGSKIGFLPMVAGKIVCACLREELNPSAPKIILAGFGPQREKSSAILSKQFGGIPVFIKWENKSTWEYVGDFEVEKASTNPKEIKERDNRRNRSEGISRIIYLREISKNKSLRLCASAVKS
jgi:hypothetical protein